MNKKEVPLFVKLISIFDWIAALFIILLVLLFLAIGIVSILNPGVPEGASVGQPEGVTIIMGIFFVFLGVFFLAIAGLLIFTAINLKKGKGTSKVTQIVISSLFILLLVRILFTLLIELKYSTDLTVTIPFFLGLLILIINGLVSGYLIFNKKAKEHFK